MKQRLPRCRKVTLKYTFNGADFFDQVAGSGPATLPKQILTSISLRNILQGFHPDLLLPIKFLNILGKLISQENI